MPDGAIHYKLYLLKLTMAVDNFVFRILKEHFNVHINLLCRCFYTIPSNGYLRQECVQLSPGVVNASNYLLIKLN